jgi:hypothetical protein
MDKWVSIAIGATLAIIQIALFETARRKQTLVLDELAKSPAIDRTPPTNLAVEQVLSTIWQRTCLRRITMMSPMLGVVLTAAGFLTLQDRLSFEARQGREAIYNSFAGALGPLYYGVLIGALSALWNQILVLVLDVHSQALLGRLLKQTSDKRSGLQATSASQGMIQASDADRLRVARELKDNVIETLTQITNPINHIANRLLEAGRGLAETQGRLQESITRFVTSTGEASLRLQESARSLQAGDEQLRNHLEGVLRSLREMPIEFQKAKTELTSKLQLQFEQSQCVTGQVREVPAAPPVEPNPMLAPLPSSVSGMSEPLKQAGESLEAITAADGTISLQTRHAPHDAYGAPGPTRADLGELLRTIQAKSQSPPSVTPLTPGFRLDHQRIHAIQTETEQVTEFLREAMRDPEAEFAEAEQGRESRQGNSSPDLSMHAQTDADSPWIDPLESDVVVANPFRGLSPDLQPFVRGAAAHRVWTRSDLDRLCRQNRLLLGSAIERVNEWSYDRLGDALFVEDKDSFLFQVELLRS